MGRTVEKRNGAFLPLIARRSFEQKAEVYHIITFLNQALKKRGIIFGVSLVPDGFEVAIYDANQPADRG